MTAPAWQRGFALKYLEEITDLFAGHDAGLILGAFTRVRETDVAGWLEQDQLRLMRNGDGELIAAAVVTRSQAWRSVTDFAGLVPLRIPPGKAYVARAACRTGHASTLRDLLGRIGPFAVEVWQEHPTDREVVAGLGLGLAAVKIRASSELRGVYSSDGLFGAAYPREQAATLTRLVVDGDVVAHHAARLARQLEYHVGGGYADHYSSYNKGHAWSALSLRGYSDDPHFIVKPAEMSRAWKAEHADTLDAPIRDTQLRAALSAAEPLLAVIPGQKHRVRVMRLQPGGGELTRHADITDPDAGVQVGVQTLRIHIPLVTNPDVVFTMWNLEGERIAAHMEVGSAWYLDTRKPHTAVNGGSSVRLHLVADVVANPLLLSMLGTEAEPLSTDH